MHGACGITKSALWFNCRSYDFTCAGRQGQKVRYVAGMRNDRSRRNRDGG